jgi:adenine-specific DNA-methyltransferase
LTTTENLIIEGDNLEVLELLQKAYLGQVRMIYIDPPYNTGNDFHLPRQLRRIVADVSRIHKGATAFRNS